MTRQRRVVITGLGALTPIGLSAGDFRTACLAGETGTTSVEFDWMEGADLRSRVGAPLVGFEPAAAGLSPRDCKTLDPVSQHAIAVTREALASAGLSVAPRDDGAGWSVEGLDPTRVAVVVGSGIGGLTTFEAAHEQWRRHATFKGSAWRKFSLPMLIPNAPAANVAIRFGFRGECKALSTACAAGTMSIGDGFRLIRDGEADVVVAGGADGVLSDHDGLGFIGFDILRVLSVRNDDPAGASRPFDRDRDGFVLGEGAAVMVLESLDAALARGARPLAEILGYASTCDAHSMMQPAPEGEMAAEAMRLALARAGLAPTDVGYVNAHATSTPVGDRAEAAAIRGVFGDGSDAPLVSATKSMTGHCIGASGALEALATVQSLADGRVHATRNLEVVEPDCALNHVIGAPASADLQAALTASYGFGGHDAVLILGRAP